MVFVCLEIIKIGTMMAAILEIVMEMISKMQEYQKGIPDPWKHGYRLSYDMEIDRILKSKWKKSTPMIIDGDLLWAWIVRKRNIGFL